MNHDRFPAFLRLAGVLLMLCVACAASLGRPAATGDEPTAASFGQWVVTTFPTAEAGFARRAPGAAP